MSETMPATSGIGETLEADKQRISGERRCLGIRRIAVAERAEGQNLPDSLTSSDEEIYETICGGTEVPNAAG